MVQKIVAFDVALKSTERQWVQKVPEVYTNDLGSVSLQFRITDCTDTELTGSTAIVLLKMRDGSFFQGPSVDVTRTLNVFSYTLKENEGNHDGLAEIQLIVTIGAKEFATQKYNFKVITGLDSEVAREIMIYDWSTLTAEARAYIDQFAADEVLRDAEFDNNQFDRNVAFNAAQGQRTTDFGLAQTQRNTDFGTDQAQRVSDFNAAEAARVQAFNNAEAARAVGYDADHSRAETDHTGATTDRTHAATDRTNAATDRTNAATDRTLAGTDHTRAEADHTRANTDSATVAGFNARVVAEETATANNKISAVKGKTFADVDARFEDVEADTTVIGTNLVTNGDFSNGTTGWGVRSTVSNFAVSGQTAIFTASSKYGGIGQDIPVVIGDKFYVSAHIKSDSTNVRLYHLGLSLESVTTLPNGVLTKYSYVGISVNPNLIVGVRDWRGSSWTEVRVDNAVVINLTATFGKGNEPTVEQMDAIMAKFENSWFDGTKNLFQAKASLNKLMALDARTGFEMKNGLPNGDISTGVTGWSAHASTLTAASNTLSATGLGDGNIVIAGKDTQIDAVVGNKLYIRLKTRIPNASASSIQPYFNGTNSSLASNAQSSIFLTSPVMNQYYTPSALVTVPSGVSGKIRIANRAIYSDAATALNSVLETQYVVVIDLTATFGEGKEPTLAEMDRLMARFPNHWFDGVKPIQTIETLYQDVMLKANNVQEAWITPTLLNGATGTLNYRKNGFGIVECYGDITLGTAASATSLMNFPVGYRPTVIGGFRAYNVTTGGRFDLRVFNDSLQISEALTTGQRITFFISFVAL